MVSRVILLFFILHLCNVHCKMLLNLTCKDIRAFVDGHNARRLQVANGKVPGHPAASQMKYMVWDNELAAKAAKWAYENKDFHNPDKNVGSGRFTTGENLYWYSTTQRKFKLDIDDALETWFAEYKDFTFAPLKRSDFASKSVHIGHYTQMIWADTTYVGCAILQNQTQKWNNFYVVCNYGPTGNYIGKSPYKPGKPSGRLVCGISDCSRPYGSKC